MLFCGIAFYFFWNEYRLNEETGPTATDTTAVSVDTTAVSVVAPSITEVFSSKMFEQGINRKDSFLLYKYEFDSISQELKVRVVVDTFPYTEYKGNKIYQGDILLGTSIADIPADTSRYIKVIRKSSWPKDKAFARKPNQSTEIKRLQAVGEKAFNRLWSKNVVSYKISSNVNTDSVRKAIDMWRTRLAGVLEFRELTTVTATTSYVIFKLGAGYSSDCVGMKGGGPQVVTIDPAMRVGNIAHEIGHVIGLWHEHSHPARDQFIIIHTDNINNGDRDQFIKKDMSSVNVNDYDFASLMHYDQNAFAIGRNPHLITIELQPAFRGKGIVFGQRNKPSDRDIEMIKNLYKK